MSRKDYIAIAAAIRDTLQCAETEVERVTLERVANRIADVFGCDNYRFDRNRFMSACGF